MAPVLSMTKNPSEYIVVGPDGDRIEIPRELFKALWDFCEGSKVSGSVTIHFRNGGVAGLEAMIRRIYK